MENSIYFTVIPATLPQVTLINTVQVEAPNNHFARTPREYILYIIRDGSMLLNDGGIEYHLKKGDILLLDPSRCHFGQPLNCSVEYRYIHFLWEDLSEIQMAPEDFQTFQVTQRSRHLTANHNHTEKSDTLLLPKISHLDSETFYTLEHLANQIQFSFQENTEFNDYITSCQFLTLLIEWNRSLTNSFAGEHPNMEPVVLDIMEYIRMHFAEKITGSLIETHFHSNFDHLNRKFKKNTGMTIFCYLKEYRLEESKQLLHSGIYTVAQVAQHTGFCNEFYFSKIFKEYTGLSPSIYKKYPNKNGEKDLCTVI